MCLFTQQEIKQRLNQAIAMKPAGTNPARLLFVPTSLNHYTINGLSEAYSHVNDGEFDTVVVIESQSGTHEKKLPMPSHKSFTTRFGEVIVNDKLRNELCDEDDDFFINDEAYSKDLSLYDQLLFLQNRLSDFSVLSLQITDESTTIVKELAAALEEILASRNALIVFCCDIHHLSSLAFKKVKTQFEEGNVSGLLNTLNSQEIKLNGIGAFFAGLLIADKWGLKLHFTVQSENNEPVAGYAEVMHQPIFG